MKTPAIVLALFMLSSSIIQTTSNTNIEASMTTPAVGLVLIMVSQIIIPTTGNTNIASVWNTIVAGAKLIGYNSYIKTYRQSGGLKQAVKDFEALEPKNVKILDDGSRHGKVGNMDVYLERLPISIVVTGKRMYMFMRVVSMVCLVATCSSDISTTGEGYSVHNRQKRSLWSQVKTILTGTDLVAVSPEFRLYYKVGGLKQAVDDFNKLDPKDIKIHDFQERSGVIEGGRIYLKSTDGPPTLVIPGRPLIHNDFTRVTRVITYYKTFEDIYKPYDNWLH